MHPCPSIVRSFVRAAPLTAVALAACAGLARSAQAQNFQLVPSTAVFPQGTGLTSLTQTSGRTYQFMIDSSELGAIQPGWEIVGLQFRLDESLVGNWPPSPVTFNDFEIRAAAATGDAAGFSNVFGNNVSADNTLVRDGALTWAANSWPGGAAVNDFGPIIAFTSPYRYAGTNVVFTISHSGQSDAPAASLDAIGQNVGDVGVSLNAQVSNSQFQAPPTSPASFCVVRVIYRPTPASNAVIVPAAQAAGPASSAQALLSNANATTVLMLMHEDQLAGMPAGSAITGVQFRNGFSATAQPPAGFFASDVSLQLSSTNASPDSFNNLIVSSLLPDAQVIGDASFGVPAGAYATDSGGVRAFGPQLPASSSFVYKGGNLAMVLRRDGTPGASLLTEAVSVSDPNYGQRFAARFASGSAASAVVTTDTAFPVMKFNIEPATVVPLGAARDEQVASASAPISSTPVTAQQVIAADQLRHIPPGSLIEAISFRIDGGFNADFPSVGDAVFTDYTVRLSTAATTPATMSATVAQNEGADVIVARNGPLVIGLGDYTSGPPAGFPNEYGPTIRLSRPFVYTGGPLCITTRHSGHNRGVGFIDGVSVVDPRYGVGFRYRATTGNALAATVNTQLSSPVVRLHFTSGGYAPVARAGVDGNSASNVPLQSDPFTYQMVLSEAEMLANSIRPGALITSLGFRLEDTRSSFPFVSSGTWNSYEVALSTSQRTPSNWSAIFATNEGNDRVVVREGPLTIRELLLQGDVSPGTANRATWRMNFTRPFLYRGGPLCITVRHDGSDLPGVTEVDAVSGAGGGVGSVIAGGHAAGAAAFFATSTTVPIPLLSATNLSPACLADIVSIGGSPPPDGLLTGDDFNAFIAAFASESLLADVCGVGGPPALPDGLLTGDDFNAFIAAFAAGCP